MVSRRALTEALSEFAVLHDRPPLTPFVARLYEEALRDWSDEKFHRICLRLSQTSKFFPKPADFIEAGGGTDSDAAQEAWHRVLGAARSVGRYASVDFGPEANGAIRALGGWVKLCESDEDELRHTQRHFLAAFSTAVRGGLPPEHLEPLGGIEALDRARLGHEGPEPKRILSAGEALQLEAGEEGAA